MLSVLPTYLAFFFPGAQTLLTIRALRLLRIFRILKLGEYVGEGKVLLDSLRASRKKITVFLSGVMTLSVIVGTLMYLVEGEENGYTSIPVSVYWAIVTLTTVGYGDIAPHTAFGKFLASLLMVIGYGVIAVPTGIVTAEITRMQGEAKSPPQCPQCGCVQHDEDALYCKRCGHSLT